MKRLCIFFLLALLTWNVRADYTPFVVEGKTWMMETSYYNSTKVQPWTFVLSGDTIINNLLYKKLLIDGRYEGAYREEGHKVYAIWSGTTLELMLYDFNLEVGDMYAEYGFEDTPNVYEVCLSDSFYNSGHYLHRIGLGFPSDGEFVSDYNWLNIWIEGVGSACGPQSSIYFTATGTGANIRYCRVGNDFLYKDTLQEFVSPDLSWADGYTQDGIVYLNRHKAVGLRQADGQTYTVMQARQYVSTPKGELLEGEPVEYLLREDAEGEAWLLMEDPHQLSDLYGITWDATTANSLANKDLYLFNTRLRRGWGRMTYGHLAPSDGLMKSWQVEELDIKNSSLIALENKNYAWSRIFSGDGIPQFLMSVGWLGYGPFYGLGDTAYGGRRFFPILYEGEDVIYQDKECMEFLRANAPSLIDIITNAEPVTFTEGQMATIVLPTEPDASKGKYYRLDRVEGNEIIFEQELQPRAHVPYIIVPSEDFNIEVDAMELEGLRCDTASVEGISFIGTFQKEEVESQEGFYIELIDTTPDCSLSPSGEAGREVYTIGTLRAYLLVHWDDPYSHGGTKTPAEKLEIVLHDDATGIESIQNSKFKVQNEDAAIYDVGGKPVNRKSLSRKSTRGIYIKDGKKVAFKQE